MLAFAAGRTSVSGIPTTLGAKYVPLRRNTRVRLHARHQTETARPERFFEIVDRMPQAVTQRRLGLPAQQFLRLADVGTPPLGIINGNWMMHDLRRRTGQSNDDLRKLADRKFGRDFPNLRPCDLPASSINRIKPVDQIVDIAE